MIGGRIQNDTRDETSGVPWVSRVPWLGRLFEHSRLASRQTELVILLRPMVVSSGVWDDELRATSGRVDGIWNKGRERPDGGINLDGWLPPTPPSRSTDRP